MSEELTEEEIAELEKQGKIITVKHEFPRKVKDSEKEALKAKVAERDSQLALIALKEFETEKEALIEQYRDDLTPEQLQKIEEIETPEQLEGLKTWTGIINKAMEYGKAPSGRATLGEGNPHGSAIERGKAVIDELYNILQDPTKSQREKDEADRRIDELMFEMIKGVHSSQQRGMFPTFTKTECPQCHELIEGRATSCDHCGWRQLVPRQERGSR